MSKDTKYIHSTAMLYMMNISKMIFPLLTLPYLTRVLSVNSYGVVAYVKAVMQYLQLIVDFGFLTSGTRDVVLMQNDGKKLNYEVGNIFAAKLLLGIVAMIVLSVVTIFIPILRENFIFVFLSFINVFLTIFLFDYVFRGLEKMEIITIRFVVMKSISTILTFVLVKNDSDIIFIPALDIISSIVAIAMIFWELQKLDIKLKISNCKDILIKIRDSAIYFCSNMASSIMMIFNTILIGIFSSKTDVAYWSVCLQLVTAVQSFYSPLTDGIYPHMIKNKDLTLVKKVLKIYIPIVTAGCVFTYFVSPYVLQIVGGDKYIAAANVLRSLILVLWFSFPAMLLGWPVLGAINRQKEVTISTVCAAVVQVIGLVILIIFGRFDLVSIALLRGVSEIAFFSMRCYYVVKYRNEFVL